MTWQPTDLDYERFEEGDCHILALALHEHSNGAFGRYSRHRAAVIAPRLAAIAGGGAR